MQASVVTTLVGINLFPLGLLALQSRTPGKQDGPDTKSTGDNAILTSRNQYIGRRSAFWPYPTLRD